MADSYDVAILGGGLAGLTLGLQLKRRRPETSVAVLEKRAGAPPMAAFKVGESTAEVAAQYFDAILGLSDYLAEHQYKKVGLRFYFPAGDNSDIAKRPEFGPQRTGSPTPTYQLDRGTFEEALQERNVEAGVDLVRGARVGAMEIDPAGNRVAFAVDGEERTITARWVVDASGRAHILRKQMGVAKDVAHTINSAWFRLQGGLDHEQWSDDPAWLERMPERGIRQRATTQLMGRGYWLWLIQLSTGPISIGLCADPRIHPFESFDTIDRFIEWCHANEPQLAAALEPRRDDVMDFLKVGDFAFGAERVYSPDRWALVGEAGAFTDPLYSPGSDFIAYGNSFVTDLVVRDLEGEDVAERLEYYNEMLLFLVERYLILYTDAYPFMGNTQVMGIKHSMDVCAYWGELALAFYKADFADVDFLRSIEPSLRATTELQRRLHDFYREWAATEEREVPPLIGPKPGPVTVGDHLFGLVQDIPPSELPERIARNHESFKAGVVILFHQVVAQLLPDADLDEQAAVNPFAISLQPDRWEADGLYGTAEQPGMTLAEAKEKFTGFDKIWLGETSPAVT